MKKVLIAMAILLISVPAFAKGHHGKKTETVVQEAVIPHSTAGVKVDAPKLVKVTENVTIGVEAGKDILSDVFRGDTRSYFEDDKGFYGYVKLTYWGSLLDFTKK